jgi:MinD superfamily P-loop ATPase
MATKHLQIAIASGKGGTGKTTMSANMAWALGSEAIILDCDVEEPNAHIFLHPQFTENIPVSLSVPKVGESKCTGCGLCGRICRYHAIAMINNKPLIFPEMCHACGGCMLVCPVKAITEIARPIGVVERGFAGPVEFVHGRLNIGEVLAPPLIRAVKQDAKSDKTTIIDCPPGTSCPVIAAIRGCDFVILVTEPTPFGLHDLRLAVDMTRELKIPFGVIVNRIGIGDDGVHVFCSEQSVPVLLEIPDDRRIAEVYSRGKMIIEEFPEFKSCFLKCHNDIKVMIESIT